MKFAETLAENLVPEWKDKYLDYKGGKKKIKKIATSPILLSLTRTHTKTTPAQLPGSGRFSEFRHKTKATDVDDHGGQSFTLPPAALGTDTQIPHETVPNQSTPLLYGHERPPSAPTSLYSRERDDTDKPERRLTSSVANPETYNVGSSMNDEGFPLENSQKTNIAEFTDWLDKQLATIDSFYREREDAAVKRYLLLQDQLYHMREERDRLRLKNSVTKDGKIVLNGLAKTTEELYKINKYELPSLPKFNLGKRKAHMEEQERASMRRDYEHHRHAVPYYVARRQLKAALQEHYRALELLKSYRMLNRTGFRKLLKKFDKKTNSNFSSTYMEKVNASYFAESDVLENLIPKAEDLFSLYFENGNRKVAVEKLRSNLKEDKFYSSMFLSGLFYGTSLPLLGYTIYLALKKTNNHEIVQGKHLIQIWAGFFMFILISVLFGTCCFIWSKYKINYRFIFEFNPRTALNYRQFHLMPSLFLMMFSLFAWFSFNNFWPEKLNAIYWPWFFFGFSVLTLTFPFDILYLDSRKWLMFTYLRLLLSGLYPVEFRDFLIGDIMSSLTYTMGNISFFFCMYATHWKGSSSGGTVCGSSKSRLMGFFSTLPALWRFLQCFRRYTDSGDWFPHLANMIKYSFTIAYYVMLSVYRIESTSTNRGVFIFFAIINSIYSGLWDIFMDWSLMQQKDLLRQDITFPKPFYYFAIVSDILLRFQWIFYALFSAQIQQSRVTSFCVAIAEIFRRFIWILIRMENEHITNLHLYRASREAPLPYETIHRSVSEEAEDLANGTDTHEEAIDIVDTTEDAEQQPPQSLRRRATIINSAVFQTVTKAIVNAHAKDFQRRKGGANHDDDGGNSSDEEENSDAENLD